MKFPLYKCVAGILVSSGNPRFYKELGLRRDENEVVQLKYFKLTDLPDNISPPDWPIITAFTKEDLVGEKNLSCQTL